MPVLLVVLLVVGPLVELYVLIQVGHVVGALPTVLLLLLVSLLGAALLRREGARAWRELRLATRTGRAPAREVADGALVMLAGALLLTPGFVSDVVGLLLLVPAVRAVLRRALTAYAARRLLDGLVPPEPPSRAGRGTRRRGSRRVDGPTGGRPGGRGDVGPGGVVEGEVEDGP